ncbi:MAG TPA: HAMP domain-containing sensor histidine kinase [Gemmatimonadaceae bacterium]|jgi:signal transduction histidine kinase|nr:HAMP domain-containing sensor histidine kinase [Gemmatimonadaceae bacterium]
MARRLPTILLGLGFAVLLGWYVVSTQRVLAELRREAARSGQMYARIFKALSDTSERASADALFDLARHIREMGVPVVVTDPHGVPRYTANIPFRAPLDGPRMRAYVDQLDAENPPVIEPGIGIVHIGNTPLVEGLRIIPILQVILLAFLFGASIFTLRTRAHADRERVWAGMARESAHQLGTPLSSLSGWVELLRERDEAAESSSLLDHMQSDLVRLERVAHRFERIGRPPKAEPVDAAELMQRVAAYFRARVPSLAHTVTVCAEVEAGDLSVQGDSVLLEWALEAIVKNAIDALAGRGGRVDLTASPFPEGGVRLRISDDGPGVPAKIRKQIFQPGFSTKQRGWGIGLSLAKRIIEENHGGRLALVPSGDRGATFEIILP